MAVNDVVGFTIIPFGTSMAADFNSASQDVRFHNRGAIQAIWTGADAVTAEIIPQASLDNVNWCDLTSTATVKKVDQAAGCQMYEFTDIGYAYWRIQFLAKTNTTGTIKIITLLKRERGQGVP